MPQRILIVDNDVGLLESFSRLPESAAYSVTLADNGLKAVEMTRQLHYDVILLNAAAPDTAGIETFSAVKAISPRTAVALMSDADVNDVAAGKSAGGAPLFVYKPFNLEPVAALVRRAGEKKKRFTLCTAGATSGEFARLLEQAGINPHDRVSLSGSGELPVPPDTFFCLVYADPRVSGLWPAVQKLQAARPEIPVVVAVDYTLKEYVDLALRAGLCLTVKKPFDPTYIAGRAAEIAKDVRHERENSVLIVEDTEALLETFIPILEEEGYAVTGVTNGIDAVKELRSRYYEIVISDYKLPDISGLDVTKKIKQIDPHTSIIFMTGYADMGVVINALKEKVVDFLTKPIDMDRLFAALAKVKSLRGEERAETEEVNGQNT